MVAKMATIVDDVTGPQQRHYPQNIPPLVEKIKGFLLMYCIADTLAASLWLEQFIQPYGKLYVRNGKHTAFKQRVMDACGGVWLTSTEEAEELQL